MPAAKYFDRCPEFPSDVPAANIPTLSLRRLAKENKGEADRLFEACREFGFFSLELDYEQGMMLVRDAENMFDLAGEVLNMPKSLLSQFAFEPPKSILGYKDAGKMKNVDDGTLDAVELYSIGQDDVLSLASPTEHPQPLKDHLNECRSFMQHAYTAVEIIFKVLDSQLGLPKGTLQKLTSPERESATSLRFLLSRAREALPMKVCTGAHTDIGLITLLFNVAGGLQIAPTSSDSGGENWQYVRPRQNCALVNLGDTLVEWTGGLVRSSLHRVVTAPGRQSTVDRISLAYLVRPAHGETMRRLRGKVIPQLDGEQEDTRTVDEWAREKVTTIVKGLARPRTIGGVPVAAI